MRRIIFFISVVVLLFSIQVQVYMFAPITNTYIKRGVCIYLIHSAVILVNDKCVCLFCFVYTGRHRWVIYTTEMNGKKTLWDVDGSMVPAEWYQLLFNPR